MYNRCFVFVIVFNIYYYFLFLSLCFVCSHQKWTKIVKRLLKRPPAKTNQTSFRLTCLKNVYVFLVLIIRKQNLKNVFFKTTKFHMIFYLYKLKQNWTFPSSNFLISKWWWNRCQSYCILSFDAISANVLRSLELLLFLYFHNSRYACWNYNYNTELMFKS